MRDGAFDQRVLTRAPLFGGIANRIRQHFPILEHETEFRADSPVLISSAYFLISDAYKPFRNSAESLTDEYKRAAISAIAVMVVRPFSPLHPRSVDNMAVYLANPMLALACANAWASGENLFNRFPFDYLKRFYLSLLAVDMPSLHPFVKAVNEDGDYRSIRLIELSHREIVAVDDWVLKFHMLVNQKR